MRRKQTNRLFILSLLISSLNADIIHINKGWNLLGTLQNMSPVNIPCVKTIWTYNSSNTYKPWSLYQSNDSTNFGYESISSLEKGRGFWINSTCEMIFDTEKNIFTNQNNNEDITNNNSLPNTFIPNDGRLLASQCAQCHGTNGVSTNSWDSIASEDDLLDEIHDDDPIMNAQAKGYTSSEIIKIENWLSTQNITSDYENEYDND